MPTFTGTVVELHRWPVKSMAGEPVDALRLDPRGAGGDRTHALWDTDRDRRLTVRQAPGMLQWRARYPDQDGAALDPATPPEPEVTGPDGTVYAWSDSALPLALSQHLGIPMRLTRRIEGQQDLPNSVLLTTQASLATLADELHAPLDLRRFRTNVHVALDAPAFSEEQGWQGGRVQIGDAELTTLHACVRCVIPTRDPDTTSKDPLILRHLAREHGTIFGINLAPLGPAMIRVGDAVEVRTPG